MLAQATESALDPASDQQALRHVRSIEATARENLAEARNLVEGTRAGAARPTPRSPTPCGG